MTAQKNFAGTPTMRVLAAGIRSNTNILFKGEPGVGKTAKLTALAAAWGFHSEVVVGSNREPQDFLGLPYEHEGTTAYLDVDWAKRLSDADKGLAFFDEFNAGGQTFKAMLRVLEERCVGNLELPDTVAMVAAYNPPDIAVDGTDIPAPIANRFVHLDWEFDRQEWLANITGGFDHITYPSMGELLGADDDNSRSVARAKIAAFLQQAPDKIRPGTPGDLVAQGEAWASPRTWDYAMRLIGELHPEDEDAIYLALAGSVGRGMAREYIAWLDEAGLYDPFKVLDDPSIPDYTERPDRIFALMSAVEAIGLDADVDTWTKAVMVVTVCAEQNRPDIAMAATQKLLNNAPEGAEDRIPQRTIDAFSDLLVTMKRWQSSAGQDKAA